MKRHALAAVALTLAACVNDGDGKKDPGYNRFTLSGELAELRFEDMISHFSWRLRIDSIYPDHPHMWDQETYGTFNVCDAAGYLGDSIATDYTNQYMSFMHLGSDMPFTVPRDTAIARGFIHWRLEISCADSIPVPK